MSKKIHKFLFLGLTTTSLPLSSLTSCTRNFSVIINNYNVPEILSCKSNDIARYNSEYVLEINFKQGYTLDLNKYSVICVGDYITDKCNYDPNIGELIIPKQFVNGFITINIVACEKIINLKWNIGDGIKIDRKPTSIRYLDYLDRSLVVILHSASIEQLTWSVLDARYRSELGSDKDEQTCWWLKEISIGVQLVIPHDFLKWDLIINIKKIK